MPRTPLHALATVFLVSATAFGADQLVLGKKLLIKNPPAGSSTNKLVHLAKDAGITLGAAGSAGDPQCAGAGGGGGSLRIVASGGAGDVTIPLPCAGWTTNGANTLYKYKDKTGATCKLVLVKAGVLAKAVCKGSQVAIDLNGTMSPVAVVTTLNAEAYCTEFGGTAVKDGSDEKTFLRKDALAPGACAVTGGPQCGNGVVEGIEQCDGAQLQGQTCQSQGHASGTLACTEGCEYDVSGCTPYSVAFCRLQFPPTANVSAGTPVEVFGRVYVPGITDQTTANDPHASLQAEVCYGPDGSDPALGTWQCSPASPNAGYGPGSPGHEPNNDEYVGQFTAPTVAGSYDYAYRFSTVGGATVYCDGDIAGSSNGYQSGNAGQLTVTATP